MTAEKIELINTIFDNIDKNIRDSTANYMRVLAGDKLSECTPLGIKGLSSVESEMKSTKEDDDFSLAIYMDAYLLATTEGDPETYFCTDEAVGIANSIGRFGKVQQIPMEDIEDMLKGFLAQVELSNSEKEASSGEKISADKEAKESEVKKDEVKEEKTSEDERSKKIHSIKDSDILAEFGSKIKLTGINNVIGRYNLLFASGYELQRPSGLLTPDGLISLKGEEEFERVTSSRDFDRTTTRAIYKALPPIAGEVCSERSKTGVAVRIYKNFSSGNKNTYLYFPRFLLQVAYGRKLDNGVVEKGNNGEVIKESKNFYYADYGKSWEAYKKELIKQLESIFVLSVKSYIVDNDWDINNLNDIARNDISFLILYTASCLSCCILAVDFKASERIPVSFNIRVCDPTDKISVDTNLSDEIICSVFNNLAGDTGKTLSSSLDPNLSFQYKVYEARHEFNHALSNAMPLFAYKALDAMKRMGKKVDWENLILGQSADGTILRNGSSGIDMSATLYHFINAGSRSGKGVMTLNFLAAGLASRKAIFYLDNKPDMISMLSYLAHGGTEDADNQNINGPEFFCCNGQNFEANQDKQKQFGHVEEWINQERIPKEVREIWGNNVTWKNNYGDLFYMRALMLTMGIIFARCMSAMYEDPVLNGEDGIMLVIDEINRFQSSFQGKLAKLKNELPPLENTYKTARENIIMQYENKIKNPVNQKGELKPVSPKDKADFNSAKRSIESTVNAKSLYALTYLNALIKSIEYLKGSRESGFEVKALSSTDVFVIGQNLQQRPIDLVSLQMAGSDDRYAQIDKRGLKASGVSTSKNNIFTTNVTTPYSFFLSKGGWDAYIGYNKDYNYLAQRDSDSKVSDLLDDKARGFAFVKNFVLDDANSKFMGSQLTKDLANDPSTVCFKPYLILNDYVGYPDETIKFAGEAHISYKDLLEEYHAEGITEDQIEAESSKKEGEKKNYELWDHRIGLPAYLNDMGLGDITGTLRKSSDIANYVVLECFHYDVDPSSKYPAWLQFITDLRLKWIFSVGDAATAIINKNFVRNSDIDREYRNYLSWMKEYGSELGFTDVTMDDLEAEEDNITGENSIASVFSGNVGSNVKVDDYSDPKEVEDIADSSMASTFEDAKADGNIPLNQPLDLDYEEQPIDYGMQKEAKWVDGNYVAYDLNGITEETEEEKATTAGQIPRVNTVYDERPVIEETNEVSSKTLSENKVSEMLDKVNEILGAFNGMHLEIQPDGGWGLAPNASETKKNDETPSFRVNTDLRRHDIGTELENVNWSDDIQTTQQLVEIITREVEQVFGPPSEYRTFRIVQNNIAVNDKLFRPGIRSLTSKYIAADVKKDVNTGIVAKYYNFKKLKNMSKVRFLEFTDKNLVYDYVSTELGWGTNFSIRNFFTQIPSLLTIKIGDKYYNRSRLEEDLQVNGEPFTKYKKPFNAGKVTMKALEGISRKSSEIGDGMWSGVEKMGSKSKAIARCTWIPGWLRATGFVVVGGATVAVGAATGGVKLGSKLVGGVKSLAEGIKNLQDT